MKFQHLIEILHVLLSRKSVSAKYLAERLNVSIRTIYRYIDDLTLANVPVVSDRGVYGGYYIPDSYKLPATFLTEEEFNKLNSVVNGIQGQIGENNQLKKIMEKLYSATKTTTDEKLTSSQLIIDGSDWSSTNSYKNKLKLITKAIEQLTMLEICYHDREGNQTKRLIEPHALVLKQGLWYVWAYCHLRQDFRLFKIGRIEYATKSKNFTKRDYDTNNLEFNSWYKSINSTFFEFEVSPQIKSDIEEWLGIENVITQSNGKIIASATLPYDKGLVYQIMKFGSGLKVLKPKKVQKEIIKEAQNLVNLYNK